MNKNRQIKHECIEQLRHDIISHEIVVVARNHGLTVSSITELRSKLFGAGDAGYKVAKNTLLQLAVKDTDAALLMDYFSGPTAIAYSQDPVGIAKILVEFTKSNEKLTLLAGLLNGRLLSDKEITALSEMPSLPELLARIVGFIQGSANELKRVILAPVMELHRVIEAISERKE